MKPTRPSLILAVSSILLFAGSANASAHATRRCVVPQLRGVSLKVAKHRLHVHGCELGKVYRPKHAKLYDITWEVVRQSPRVHARRRYHAKVRIWLKVKSAKKHVTPTPVTITAPTVTAPTTTAPTVVRAGIDPDFTQDATDNLKVTWTYSASAGAAALPDGVLTFSVTPATGGLAPVGGCSINVGALTTGGTCTVELSNYGVYTTTVTYTGSGSTVAPSTQTATDTIEPLPITNTYTWGTNAPTSGAYVQTILQGDTANVTVGDPNFEGATSVDLTDSTGAQCTATVSGITATCTMTDIATPTSYTISYPGGTTTTTTVATANNGQQSVTDQWPATVVQINNPQVTVQQVTLVECGGRDLAGGWSLSGTGCTSPTSPIAWPSSVTTSAGPSGQDALILAAWAYGSLQDDPNPSGTVNYTVTPGVEGTDYTIDNTPCGPQCGFEEISFLTPGTYTVSTSFTSTDPNYVNQTNGPTITITVVS